MDVALDMVTMMMTMIMMKTYHQCKNSLKSLIVPDVVHFRVTACVTLSNMLLAAFTDSCTEYTLTN
jgi:hypothetical protein